MSGKTLSSKLPSLSYLCLGVTILWEELVIQNSVLLTDGDLLYRLNLLLIGGFFH